jgi:uncharacterized protein (TIGR02145 family)/uncharacterized repeat protein (TIGR02543 family)
MIKLISIKRRNIFLTTFIAVTMSVSSALAQDYNITFAILGSNEKPATVKVENTTQSTEKTLTGSDVLNLVKDITTGISDINANASNALQVYPNPVKENATVAFINPVAGKVTVSIVNTTGAQVASIRTELPQGEVSYTLSGLSTGTYVVHVQASDYQASCVILSQLESTSKPSIVISSSTALAQHSAQKQSILKTTKAAAETVKMQYNAGDVLKFTATLNTVSAVVDNYIATISDEVEFSFPVCTITYYNVGTKNATANPATYTIATADITLVVPADSAGFTFGGWFTDAAFIDTVSTPAIAQGSIGDAVFYAKWGIIDSRDNNFYRTVKIGNQVWTAENLAYLPEVQNNADFATNGSVSQPAYGVYGYDGSNVATAKAEVNYNIYGVLYNWHVIDQTNVCPSGWYVPSDEEWKTLEMELGMSQAEADQNAAYRGTDQGSQLAGNADLWSDALLDENAKFGSSEFSALPSGFRYNSNGNFTDLGTFGYWWSSAAGTSSTAYHRSLNYNSPTVYRNDYNKLYGFSVRCVMSAITYNITYYNVEGAVNTNPATYSIETHNITLVAPTNRAGYTFAGWFTDASFADTISTPAIAQGSMSDTVFYAKWDIKINNITYHNVGTKNAIANPATYTIETADITLAVPTDSAGFTFGGWFTDAAYIDTVSSPAIAQGSIGDAVFYAKWGIIDSRDNNFYRTVKIGNQVWTAENLAYLPEVQNNADFATNGSALQPAYGVYGYDGSNVATAKAEVNYGIYGVLYNWYVIDQTNVCPSGWHVPSDEEWKTLEMELGMSQAEADQNAAYRGTDQGSQLAGNEALWSDALLDANAKFGSSEFSALPSGFRYNSNGNFTDLGTFGYLWSSTEGTTGTAYHRSLNYNSPTVYRRDYNKLYGFSVRCVKD